MTSNDISQAITQWTEWASKPDNQRYDIALLKIWIQFEKFVGELFVTYSIGGTSEAGFSPTLKVRFYNEEHLNAFLRNGNHTYIDYLSQVQKLLNTFLLITHLMLYLMMLTTIMFTIKSFQYEII